MARKYGRASSGGDRSDDLGRIEPNHELARWIRIGHRDSVLDRPTVREIGEQARYLDRDAGAHQHVVHSGQHRAVDRVGGRQLELLEVVDADRPVVALLRQPDLGEVGDHGELTQRRRRLDPTEWHTAIARALRPSTRREPPVEHAGRQRRNREVCVGATQVTTVVAVTQTAGMHDIESGTRDHSELAELCRPQPPGASRTPPRPCRPG